MTVGDAICKANELEPNQYATQRQIEWLSALDGKIFNEIICTHEDPIREHFEGYRYLEEELIVPFPYAEELYVQYLLAKIADGNAESEKYENARIQHNEALQEFGDWYNRSHMPKSGLRFWF